VCIEAFCGFLNVKIVDAFAGNRQVGLWASIPYNAGLHLAGVQLTKAIHPSCNRSDLVLLLVSHIVCCRLLYLMLGKLDVVESVGIKLSDDALNTCAQRDSLFAAMCTLKNMRV
jgi:hypothetical protein